MRGLFVVAIVAVALLLGGFIAIGSKVEAAPAVPRNAETETNKCVLYSANGVFSGGIPVVYPATVSYKLQDSFYFLWLPGQDRLKVDTLSVTALPPDGSCFGII